MLLLTFLPLLPFQNRHTNHSVFQWNLWVDEIHTSSYYTLNNWIMLFRRNLFEFYFATFFSLCVALRVCLVLYVALYLKKGKPRMYHMYGAYNVNTLHMRNMLQCIKNDTHTEIKKNEIQKQHENITFYFVAEVRDKVFHMLTKVCWV